MSAGHSQALRAALRTYIAHARKVGRTRRTGLAGRRGGSALDTHAVRGGAKEQGIDIKERGRVPADVVAKYREAIGQ